MGHLDVDFVPSPQRITSEQQAVRDRRKVLVRGHEVLSQGDGSTGITKVDEKPVCCQQNFFSRELLVVSSHGGSSMPCPVCEQSTAWQVQPCEVVRQMCQTQESGLIAPADLAGAMTSQLACSSAIDESFWISEGSWATAKASFRASSSGLI